jgi:hypothetical protein
MSHSDVDGYSKFFKGLNYQRVMEYKDTTRTEKEIKEDEKTK